MILALNWELLFVIDHNEDDIKVSGTSLLCHSVSFCVILASFSLIFYWRFAGEWISLVISDGQKDRCVTKAPCVCQLFCQWDAYFGAVFMLLFTELSSWFNVELDGFNWIDSIKIHVFELCVMQITDRPKNPKESQRISTVWVFWNNI